MITRWPRRVPAPVPDEQFGATMDPFAAIGVSRLAIQSAEHLSRIFIAGIVCEHGFVGLAAKLCPELREACEIFRRDSFFYQPSCFSTEIHVHAERNSQRSRFKGYQSSVSNDQSGRKRSTHSGKCNCLEILTDVNPSNLFHFLVCRARFGRYDRAADVPRSRHEGQGREASLSGLSFPQMERYYVLR